MYKFFLLFLLAGAVQAQEGWDLFATTELKPGFDEFLGEETEVPEFSDALKSQNNKRITLEGYIIPLQQGTAQDFFVLSRFPYQSCFFCGAAGPETVAEVYSSRKVGYTDERVRVTGTLTLNEDDPLHLFFIIRDCEVVKLD